MFSTLHTQLDRKIAEPLELLSERLVNKLGRLIELGHNLVSRTKISNFNIQPKLSLILDFEKHVNLVSLFGL